MFGHYRSDQWTNARGTRNADFSGTVTQRVVLSLRIPSTVASQRFAASGVHKLTNYPHASQKRRTNSVSSQ